MGCKFGGTAQRCLTCEYRLGLIKDMPVECFVADTEPIGTIKCVKKTCTCGGK
jgi:hypothetical protein